MAELDSNSIEVVLEKLGPRSRARCACINRTWRWAADELKREHWLIVAEGDCLRMYNILTGREKVVKLDLPGIEKEKLELRQLRVLCSFRGLTIIRHCKTTRGAAALPWIFDYIYFLGDPLLNKWIELAPLTGKNFGIAGFCSSTSTLLLSNEFASTSATLSLETAEWRIDPPHGSKLMDDTVQEVCCLDGLFYTVFMAPTLDPDVIIACYDPVNRREWSQCEGFEHGPVFLCASHFHDRLLLYTKPDRGRFIVSEAAGGSNGRLKVAESSLMDDELWEAVRPFERSNRPPFHGEDGIYMSGGRPGTIKILSLKDNALLREVENFSGPGFQRFSRAYYYVSAPGKEELLTYLDTKAESPFSRKIPQMLPFMPP